MLALRELSGDLATIELHAPREEFLYRPLAVAEPFGGGKVLKFDLRGLTERCGATFRRDNIASVDTDGQRITNHDGDEVAYDFLVVACGTRMMWSVPGAVTFWGVPDEGRTADLMRDLIGGELQKVIFAVPGGPGWPLPIYELALIASSQLARSGNRDGQLEMVTSEDSPLNLFGVRASQQMGELLAGRGINVVTKTHPVKFQDGEMSVVPGDPIAADAAVCGPSLEGRPIDGLPHDGGGFVPVDAHGQVSGLERVFAVGDITNFPVKQGGIAAQQADAAAEAIAARLGGDLEPQPFDPVLRGKLMTGEAPQYLYGRLTGGHGESSSFSDQPSWHDDGKIVGKYIAPFLSSISNVDPPTSFSPTGEPKPS